MKTIQKSIRLKVLMALMVALVTLNVQAQVRIGEDAAPTKGAVLDLNSDNKTAGYVGGLKLPNVSLANLTDLLPFSEVPANVADLKGAIVYNTNTNVSANMFPGTYYWDGAQWVLQATAGATSGQILKWNGTAWSLAPDEVGVTTITQDGPIIVTNGSTFNPTVGFIAGLNTNDVLTWNGSSWVSKPAGGITTGNLTSANTAALTVASGTSRLVGGDASITVNNTANIWNANQLQGNNVATTAPTNNQVLKWNGTSWAPGTDDNTTYTVIAGAGAGALTLTPSSGSQQNITLNVGVTSVGVNAPITNSGTATAPNLSLTTGNLTSTNTAALTVASGTSRLVGGDASITVNNTANIWNANQLQGKNITTTAPTDGQVLTWNSGTSLWTPATPATGNFWSLTGNTGTTAGTNFLGTIDNQDLVFKRNNIQAGWLNSNNTAFGVSSLPMTTKATYCTAVGFNALPLSNATGGNYNTAVGAYALSSNTGGTDGAGDRGDSNNAFGYYTLNANTTGNKNNAFGNNALSALTTGDHNNAFGNNALSNNKTGQYNDAFGAGALANNTNSNNAAFGSSALNSNATGVYNAAFGGNALINSTGSNNAACGNGALSNLKAGDYNTAIGSGAGSSTTAGKGLGSGSNNVFIGYGAGGGLSTTLSANNNVFIGYNAGSNSITSVTTNNIIIGSNGQLGDPTASNQISIGNLINASGATGGGNGNVAIGAASSATYKLNVGGTVASSGVALTSDARYKKNITTISTPLDIINQLRGTSYEFRTDEFPDKNFKEGKQLGVIAQEVEKVLPELVTTDSEGYKSVNYEGMIPVLIEGMKAQQQIIEQLEARVKVLEAAK